jgi:hypothetical protein
MVTASSILFPTSFSSKPIVTVEILTSSNNLYNISTFIKNITVNGFDIQFSSNFSGSLKYRAIYAVNYPVVVERLPLLPTNFYTASAGTVHLNNSDSSNITYNTLYGNPTDLFLTIEDNGNNTGQVYPSVYGTIDVTSSVVKVSSQTDSTLNFIVVK